MGRVTAGLNVWGFFSCTPEKARELVGSGFACHVGDMQNKSWWTLFSLLNLFLCMLVTGCGKGYGEKDEDSRQEERAVAQYETNLKPLNTRMGRYSGHFSVSITDNQFWARMSFEGPRTGQMSSQYIHTGSRCPTMADDRNNDGYLDFMEAHQVIGDILIPLDSILEAQLRGMNLFPKLKKNNSYYYSEAANYARMMDDLRKEDSFSSDMITKLGRGEELNLSNRVVLVYGVNDESRLPATVESFDGYPPQASLPVACGEIRDIF